MSTWGNKSINLGTIKENVKKIIIFEALNELNNIHSMSSSCGCSTPKQDGNKIVVSYTPGTIPFHLISQGFYNTTKTITITYKDGTTDILSFKAKITK
jgi:hypothetical protein